MAGTLAWIVTHLKPLEVGLGLASLLNESSQTALQTLRRFHQEVALLLQTADAMMQERGYPTHRSVARTATAYYSYVIDAPTNWTPEFAFRWYSVGGHPNVAAFISVIMCPRQQIPGVPRIDEPLVSAGVAGFHERVPTGARLYHFARAIGWTSVERDGTWASHAPAPDKHGRIDMEVMGLPLTEVSSTDQLRNLVVSPLTERLPPPQASA